MIVKIYISYEIVLFSVNYIYCNICPPGKRVEMKKTQFLNRRFDVYNTRRRWSVHFPNSFRQVPRRSRPEEAELVLCQRLSLISNMASIETDGSSTELEVRYRLIAQIVVNIPFVTVFEKLPSFEICFISVIVINKPCPSKSIIYYSYI